VARASWISQAARIAWKDLHIEGRSREVLYTMGFMPRWWCWCFLSPSFPGKKTRLARRGRRHPVGRDPVLGHGGPVAHVDRERESEAIRSLLLSPVPRSAIYAGKLAATAAVMFLVELLLAPLLARSFPPPSGRTRFGWGCCCCWEPSASVRWA